MTYISAPGKVILFGEHAVVYGEPAVAVAVEKRMYMSFEPGEGFKVNNYDLSPYYHSYIYHGVNNYWKGTGIDYLVESQIPTAAGLGSSAALSVCTSASLGMLRRRKQKNSPNIFQKILNLPLLHEKRTKLEQAIANRAFNIEYTTQGKASPIDTSASTHGSGIIIRREKGDNFLWDISKDDKTWFIHHMDTPNIQLILGNTGIKSRTQDQVNKVKDFVNKSNFGMEIITDIGEVVEAGVEALERRDLKRTGELMNHNHKLLGILGVSHPRLEQLIKVVRRYSLGAKLTGAGGGGSFIALTETPKEAIKALERFNIETHKLSLTKRGITLENENTNKKMGVWHKNNRK